MTRQARTTRSKVRVAIVGHTGRGNYGHGLDKVWTALDDVEIVGVADPDPQGREAAARRLGVARTFANYRELLDRLRPDVVSIAPRWIDQHASVAMDAIQRGIHIYMEKPFCRDLEEADRIVEACTRHRVKLALAHQTRYSPLLSVIRNLIESGDLGDLLELRGRGKEDHRGGGEDLWVLGSHVMNLIHYFGGEPLSCFARIRQNGHRALPADVRDGNEGLGPIVGDQLEATFELDGGASAYFASRQAAGGSPTRFGLTLMGSKGIVELQTGFLPTAHYLPDSSWSPGRTSKRWIPIRSTGVGQPETLPDKSLHAGNIAACRDLLAAIREDRDPECSALEGRVTIEMIMAVFASHRSGQPVAIPLAQRKHPLANG